MCFVPADFVVSGAEAEAEAESEAGQHEHTGGENVGTTAVGCQFTFQTVLQYSECKGRRAVSEKLSMIIDICSNMAKDMLTFLFNN